MKATKSLLTLTLLAAFFLSPLGFAQTTTFSYTVSVSDPTLALGTKKTAFLNNLKGAMQLWNSKLLMKGRLRVRVIVSTQVTRLEANSVSNIHIGYSNGIPVYEEGAGYTIRTGLNLPTTHDMLIKVNPNYLATEVWYDPGPLVRTATVPTNKIDLVSLLAHEIGHAFGFNGFADQLTGRTNPLYLSRFDRFVRTDVNGTFFAGPNAKAVFGSRVPLTPQNIYHYATPTTPRLFRNIMNGVVLYYGTRYSISALDVAIMKDLGQKAR